MVSISNHCLCGVNLPFSFCLCSSAMVTAIERGAFFSFCEISWSFVVLFHMKGWTQISSLACKTSLLFSLCFSCCRIWNVIDMRRKTIWIPHTSGFSSCLSFINFVLCRMICLSQIFCEWSPVTYFMFSLCSDGYYWVLMLVCSIATLMP